MEFLTSSDGSQKSGEPVARRPEIISMLHTYADELSSAVDILRCLIPTSISMVPFNVPLPKQMGELRTAKETTLVDSSLPMVDAIREAVLLNFPDTFHLTDTVLQSVCSFVAQSGGDIVQHRARCRDGIRNAKRIVQPLTRALRTLVPSFAAPINEHVDFGFLEAVCVATGWVQHNVVDLLIYGFQPVGCVPFCGCHRPTCEKAPEPFSAQDNLDSFDKASELLHRKARKA